MHIGTKRVVNPKSRHTVFSNFVIITTLCINIKCFKDKYLITIKIFKKNGNLQKYKTRKFLEKMGKKKKYET